MEPASKIMPLSIEQTYTDNTVTINSTKFQSISPEFDITSLVYLTPRQMYATENLCGLNYKKETELVSDIPCALFKNHTPLPPHTPISLNFRIDSNNYHINLIYSAGAFPTADVVAATTTTVAAHPPTIVKMTSQDSQKGPPNCIGVGVVDVWLYLYCEQYDDITNKTYPYD